MTVVVMQSKRIAALDSAAVDLERPGSVDTHLDKGRGGVSCCFVGGMGNLTETPSPSLSFIKASRAFLYGSPDAYLLQSKASL